MSGLWRTEDSLDSILYGIGLAEKKHSDKLQKLTGELYSFVDKIHTEDLEVKDLCEALMNEVKEANLRADEANVERDEYKSLADSLIQVIFALKPRR